MPLNSHHKNDMPHHGSHHHDALAYHGDRIAVIGAGVAGVAMATALSAYNIKNFVVYDRNNKVGGIWTNNYPGAGVQTATDSYEFPDKRFPKSVYKRSEPPCPTADEVCDYLEEYVQEKGIQHHFEFGVIVWNVTKHLDGTWEVLSSKGRETFDYVIVCSGLLSTKPIMLEIPGMEEFEESGGRIMHSSERTSDTDFKGKRVLVIGNGKSAADAAMAASDAAMKEEGNVVPPVQVVRQKNWYMPRDIFGILSYKWLIHSRLGSSLLPRHYETSDALWNKTLYCLLAPMKWIVWRIIELIVFVHLRLPWNLRPPFGTIESFTAFGFSTPVTDDKHLRKLRRGDIDMRVATVSKLEPGKAILDTGDIIPTDVVVMGTGWEMNYDILDTRTVIPKLCIEGDGLWLYRNILPTKIQGIAFVGSNTSSFMNIFTHYVQAFWLAGLLAGRREWPSVEVMEDNLRRDRAHRRLCYPFGPLRGASIQAFLQHYHDVLYKEQGVNPSFFKLPIIGPIANLIMPVIPVTVGDVLVVAAGKDKCEDKGRQIG